MAALTAISDLNEPPYIFRYGGFAAWIDRDDDGDPIVQTLTPDHLRHELARAMVWYKLDDRERRRVLPPLSVVKDILVTPCLPFPVLERIVEAPVFGSDGALQTTPGYHSGSRTYYIPEPDLCLPRIADEPSAEDVERAWTLLAVELLGDFPFVSDADKAHAMAFFLLPYVRGMIDGPTPLHLFEKPTPGTGATLLINMLAYVATGRDIAAMTEGGDDEEYRKRLTSKLRRSPTFVLIDNVRQLIDSAALAAALTATTWEDRLLGHSQIIRLPVKCVWAATGNNPSVSNEIARRAIRIRADAKMQRPWLRTQFRHPDLKPWVTEHRGELLWAALTIIQSWIAAGRPQGTARFGMFESWAQVMGGILDMAGVPGFLGNLSDLYNDSDEESAVLHEFFRAWHSKFKDRPVGVAEVWSIARQSLDLGREEQGQKIRLGKILRQNKDRQYGDLRLVGTPHRPQGCRQWRVIPLS